MVRNPSWPKVETPIAPPQPKRGAWGDGAPHLLQLLERAKDLEQRVDLLLWKVERAVHKPSPVVYRDHDYLFTGAIPPG